MTTAIILSANFVTLAVGMVTVLGGVTVAIIQNRGLARKANIATQAADKAATAAELTALHADVKVEEVKQVVTDNLGTKNGNGSVVEMLEQVLTKMDVTNETVGQQDKRIVDLRLAVESLHLALDTHIKWHGEADSGRYVDPPRHVPAPPRGPGRVRPLLRKLAE